MNKKKSRILTQPDSQFYSSLTLDEAWLCLVEQSPTYEVTGAELDSDSYQFQIVHPKPVAAEDYIIEGSLRRWEGTFTLVEYTGYFRPIKTPPHKLDGLAKLIAYSPYTILATIIALPVLTGLVVWGFDYFLGKEVSILLAIVLLTVGVVSDMWQRYHTIKPPHLETIFKASGMIAMTPDALVQQLDGAVDPSLALDAEPQYREARKA